jgi:hypothetical protein
MMPRKEVIRLLLGKWSEFGPGFRMEGDRLVSLNSQWALAQLEQNSMDILAFSACQVDDQLSSLLSINLLREQAFQLALAQEADHVFELLAHEKIEAVLLKGLSLQPYYPEDCLRPSYDVDLLVHPQHKQKCFFLFEASGYIPVDAAHLERRMVEHGELEWVNPRTKMVIECHWDLINSPSLRRSINFDPDIIFARLEKQNLEPLSHPVTVLAPAMALAYLMCHHVLHHQFRGLLWLADVLLVLTSGHVDWKDFKTIVRELKVEHPVYYYMTALKSLFGPRLDSYLSQLKNILVPRSIAYSLFSRFNPPESIFKHRPILGKLKDQLFRNSFKSRPI